MDSKHICSRFGCKLANSRTSLDIIALCENSSDSSTSLYIIDPSEDSSNFGNPPRPDQDP
jgi:hypothetical protein